MRSWLGWSGAWISGAAGERRFPISLGHGVCSGASATVNWGSNRGNGDGSTNYCWEKPGTPCCSHQTIYLNMEIFMLINEIHETRAPEHLKYPYITSLCSTKALSKWITSSSETLNPLWFPHLQQPQQTWSFQYYKPSHFLLVCVHLLGCQNSYWVFLCHYFLKKQEVSSECHIP